MKNILLFQTPLAKVRQPAIFFTGNFKNMNVFAEF